MNTVAEQSPIHAYFKQMGEMYGEDMVLSRPIAEIMAAVVPAQAAPQAALDWDTLQANCLACTQCRLHATRKQVVWGEGNPHANLLIIGEAPGADEDEEGKPFVGAAGQLLTKILQAIGFERDEVFITNILKCRLQNNRDPQPDEILGCRQWLNAQIASVDPKIILALGRIAGQVLLDTDQQLGKMRGQMVDFEGRKLMVTYHPAALLRNSNWKRPTWEDVQKLRAVYDSIAGDKGQWKPQKAN